MKQFLLAWMWKAWEQGVLKGKEEAVAIRFRVYQERAMQQQTEITSLKKRMLEQEALFKKFIEQEAIVKVQLQKAITDFEPMRAELEGIRMDLAVRDACLSDSYARIKNLEKFISKACEKEAWREYRWQEQALELIDQG